MTDADVENWKLKCPECGFTRTKIRKTGMEYIAPGVHATKEDEVPNPEEITKTICTSCGKETLHWYFERVSLARSWWDF